jgi:hypothetical protein
MPLVEEFLNAVTHELAEQRERLADLRRLMAAAEVDSELLGEQAFAWQAREFIKGAVDLMVQFDSLLHQLAEVDGQ